MKKIYRLLALALSCIVLLGFSACGEDDLSTNQYTGGVSLNVFGPSPVVRGGTLRFLGSNLDQVKQVVIPGVNPITDIEVVQSGVPSEIRVQVPKDGPEEGYVTLVTASGAELTTETMLTYEETIEFTSFSPARVMPGDVLTIEGDYLNLIKEVIFADEVTVSEQDFLSHDRYKITLTVPEAAQTGEVVLSDGDEDMPNLISSENELEVGTATVESFTAARFKANETLTIAGQYLNLVDYVKFVGIEVPSAALAEEGAASFTVNEEGTTITLAQPAEAASGAVSLVLRSGVEVVVNENFEVVVPTGLAVASASVKAGAPLTITGADLDLVTGVTFPTDVDGGTITVTSTQLVVASVPDLATEGNLALNMANGMSVTVAYQLVKPVVTGYSANPVSAGASLTLNGTDLDLVSSVSIGGGSAATPEKGSTATALSITVPMDSKSGAVVLTLANGTTVQVADLTVNEAVFCYITELPNTDETEVTAGSLLAVPVANGDKLTGVEVNGTAVQYILMDGTLNIGIPESAGKGTTIRLISSNGEVSYTIDVTSENGTVIWTGSFECANWNAFQDYAWNGYDWTTVKAGDTLVFSFTLSQSSTYWQIRVAKGNGWTALTGTNDQYDLAAGTTEFAVTLTDAMVNELVNDGGLILTGHGYTLTKISIR